MIWKQIGFGWWLMVDEGVGKGVGYSVERLTVLTSDQWDDWD